ncbi:MULTISPECIES: nicotinate-nucleotide adenylyltransferase [Paenibacillus]|uniref:Probable nicotinate-nucleotide adenylyltransferase n=1 Tax=Paenibacillus glycanilyticus TaxID=126569 RepID=A0ABQ6NV72_9BACL|nr:MULTISPECIES: nicotinate-nucleotide adenylyltransferase [Paenibacillus]MCK9862769.1 nicotinate-nucleotide adenylyltransferase [Paenibacillus sp. ATY16]GMK48473.1 nicotinate-nucleotide adenylyltransferase [Paenibacillus glycanilyticus]
MSKIGIMGGTFDPVHTGHLIAAEAARDGCGLDEVWFIPTYQPPLKDNEPGASSKLRLQMVQEALGGNPAFKVLDIELERGGMSYSIDTVLELKRRYPDKAFSYIIGSDRINDLPKWHRIEELAELITFIGLEREGTAVKLDELPEFLRRRVTMADMPPIGISSTEIRSRVHAGRSIAYLVPDTVHQFIKGRGLYES